MANITVDIKKKSIEIGSSLVAIGKGGMNPGVYDPQEIKADVFDMDNMVDGIDKHYLTTEQIEEFENKQDALTAGENIDITNNVISATDTTYTAGEGISIDENNVISNTSVSAEWGNIEGDIEDQADLQEALAEKQDILTAGDNVQIENNVISATDTTYTAGEGISIDSNNVISNTQTSAEWGNIEGDIEDQTDLKAALDSKQNTISDLSQIRSNATAGKNASDTIATYGDIVTHDVDEFVTSDAIGEGVLTIQKNSTTVDTFSANAKTDKTINITVPTQASDIGAMPDTTKYAANLEMSINSSTYVITTQLKDQDGNNIGAARTVDLPLESVVVDGEYDAETKNIILTLENGNTIEFSVADLVSGLQTEITVDNKLDADLVDDTTASHKFVTSTEKSCISTAVQPGDLSTYAKCSDIPTDNSQLANGCGYTTCTGTLVPADIANKANCSDIPTDNCQLGNGCGYTTCTGTLVQSDLNPYAKCCDIPTDNSQLANGCGYTTCTGTLVPSDIANKANCSDIPTDNCQLANGCGYTTCTGDMQYSDFNFTTLNGGSVTLDLSSKILPLSDFTINAPDTIEDGQIYILRVQSSAIAYTMTLGTDITNPSSVDISLTPNAVDQFVFIAVDNKLELQSDTPDLSGYQTISNMVQDLNNPDHSHYPTAKAVADAMACAGVGDMLQSVYDPCGCEGDAFDYRKLHHTPAIPTDNRELANGCGYTTCTGTLVESDIANLAKCCDIPTDNSELANGCGYIKGINCSDVTRALGYTPYNSTNPNGYTTCTGTLVASDIINKADCSDIPTDNCQLANSCGYTTCTGTLVASDIANLAKCCDIPTDNSQLDNGCGYTTCTGTVVAADIQDLAKCCDIPINNSQLANGCGYTTCTGTLVQSDIANLAKCCDIPTDNCQLSNGCNYATCTYVNDSINSVTAYYITKDAAGNQFATYAELNSATTFYSGGEARIPTRNDYTVVLADETHDDATTRYSYNNGWEYQYTVNETALTQVQLDALNSGITCSKVSCYDSIASSVSGFGNIVNCNASDFAKPSDIPTDNCQLANGCGYTTCTGDVEYSDYTFVTKTGSAITLDLSSYIEPSANFTVNAPSEIKEGQIYMLRVSSGATAYQMTLGTNIVNPHSTSTALTANAVDQFAFLAVGGKLELQPADVDTTYTAGEGLALNGNTFSNTGVISVNGCSGAVSLNIPTDNCQLANGCGYIKGITCANVTSALGYTPYNSTNPNGYTTCTGTLVASDIANLAKCCDIPTNNNQLTNGCRYIKGITCANVTTALGYTPYNSTNPNGYTSCTGTLVPSDLNNYAKCCDIPDVSEFVEESCIATINGCCLTNGGDICIQGGGGADIYGDGSDGDCIIESDTVMCAREYCFENFIVCSGATLRFCGDGVPVIKACCCIDNQGIIDLKGYDVRSNDYELIFGVGCVKRVANVPFCIPEITETGGLSGGGYAGNGGGPGESGCNSTCPGGSGAVCAGGGGGGRCSSSVAASAGGNATNCCGGNGGSGMYGGGGGYGYIRGGNGGNSGRSGPAGNGGNGYCCGGDGGSNTTLCDGCGGKGGDARYYGGNGGKGGGAAKGGDGGFGYYCKGGNGGDSCYGEGGKGGDSYWGCGGNGGAGGGGNYSNNGGDGGYGYIMGGNGGDSRTQYPNGNRRGGKGGDSRLQGGNGGNGAGGKALGGYGGSSVMGMYGIVLIGYSVLSCCITGYGGNGGNGGTGACGAGGGGNGGDGADVMIVYKDSVISGCIENYGGKGGCTGGTTTVSGKDGKDGACEIIHYAG